MAPISPDNPFDIERLLRPELRKLTGYQALEPTEALAEQAAIPPEQAIKLDGNENPYGPLPHLSQALASYRFYHHYPDPLQRQVRRALRDYVGVDEQHIVVGSGSDELIDLVLRLFISPGDKVINLEPTFGMYRFNTQVCGGTVVTVSRNEAFAADVAAVKAAVDERTKVIFVASPNNPSGNITAQEDILALLETGVVVVVDEAYYEFCHVTVAPLVPQYPNLVVLRTFSKWAGLAGLRIGYGIFPPLIARHVVNIKPPYNVTAAAQVAALESLADREYLPGTIKAIVAERERLYAALSQSGILKPLPSQANFLLCRVEKGDALEIKQALAKRGIFIRHFDTDRLRGYLRISVGKPEHTDALIAALDQIGGEHNG